MGLMHRAGVTSRALFRVALDARRPGRLKLGRLKLGRLKLGRLNWVG
jgi:hypothetical protein